MHRQRLLVVLLMTSLCFAGALHHPPLWIFVVVIPIWLPFWLRAEHQRIHDEAIEQVRSRLQRRFGEDE